MMTDYEIQKLYLELFEQYGNLMGMYANLFSQLAVANGCLIAYAIKFGDSFTIPSIAMEDLEGNVHIGSSIVPEDDGFHHIKITMLTKEEYEQG